MLRIKIGVGEELFNLSGHPVFPLKIIFFMDNPPDVKSLFPEFYASVGLEFSTKKNVF
jgi:hypothetical protein